MPGESYTASKREWKTYRKKKQYNTNIVQIVSRMFGREN